MSHTQRNFGIVTELSSRRFTIFDTDNLTVLHQIDNPSYRYNDVAITSDCSRALLTGGSDPNVVLLDLLQEPPQVIDDEPAPNTVVDVAITPDNLFGVFTGGLTPVGIVSYSLQNQSIVDNIPNLSVQAVDVSPNGNGMILCVDLFTDSVRVLTIDQSGNLTDTGITAGTGGAAAANITFHPTGNFAFVPHVNSHDVAVFDTSTPTPVLLTNIPTNIAPQTVVTTKDGNRVFVLTLQTVDIFSFTPDPPYLTLESSFSHGFLITLFVGIDQMALDHTETKLFISASNSNALAAFGLDGTLLGTVPGVLAEGGVATCSLQIEPITIDCPSDNYARK